MRTTKKDKEWQTETAEYYAQCLDKGGTLLISITHTSQSNLSYRYKVWLMYVGENPNSGTPWLYDLNATYWLADVRGENLTDRDELKGSGVGFNRYQFIFNDFCSALESCGIDLERYRTDRGTYTIGYSAIN